MSTLLGMAITSFAGTVIAVILGVAVWRQNELTRDLCGNYSWWDKDLQICWKRMARTRTYDTCNEHRQIKSTAD